MALRVLSHGVFALALMLGAYWPLWDSKMAVSEQQRAAADPLNPLAGPTRWIDSVYDPDALGEELAEEKPLIYRISLNQWRRVR